MNYKTKLMISAAAAAVLTLAACSNNENILTTPNDRITTTTTDVTSPTDPNPVNNPNPTVASTVATTTTEVFEEPEPPQETPTQTLTDFQINNTTMWPYEELNFSLIIPENNYPHHIVIHTNNPETSGVLTVGADNVIVYDQITEPVQWDNTEYANLVDVNAYLSQNDEPYYIVSVTNVSNAETETTIEGVAVGVTTSNNVNSAQQELAELTETLIEQQQSEEIP